MPRSPLDRRAIDLVLSGHESFDALPGREQAFVRRRWSEKMDELGGALDLRAEFEAGGVAWWVEAGTDGSCVLARPTKARR